MKKRKHNDLLARWDQNLLTNFSSWTCSIISTKNKIKILSASILIILFNTRQHYQFLLCPCNTERDKPNKEGLWPCITEWDKPDKRGRCPCNPECLTEAEHCCVGGLDLNGCKTEDVIVKRQMDKEGRRRRNCLFNKLIKEGSSLPGLDRPTTRKIRDCIREKKNKEDPSIFHILRDLLVRSMLKAEGAEKL